MVICVCYAVILSGCRSVQRPLVQPTIDLPDAYSTTGSQPLGEKWWHSFNDSDLDALIEQALRDNFSIHSAWNRLQQAEQIAVKARAPLLPDVDYSGSFTRYRQDGSGSKTYSNSYSLGLAASYELDLWGRIDSTARAAGLDVQAAREDVSTAAITLTASIAKTWYQLIESQLQEKLITQQIETNTKVLDIVTVQFRKAKVAASDVFRQRQLIESTQGQLIQARENSALLQHRLAVLLGQNPSLLWTQQEISLIDLPPLPNAGIPSDLLTNRPDLLGAYKSIQAADMRVAAAIIDQYPRVSFSASIETDPSQARDLFDDWLASLGANLTGPLFDAGLKKAEVLRTQALLSELINEYQQSVLTAVQELEDALVQQQYQKQYMDNLAGQLTLARQVYERTRQSYLKGQVDYIRVLDALVSQQSLERSELTARRQLIESRVDLCRALGGRWHMQRPDDNDSIRY